MQQDIHNLLSKYFSGQASAEETEMVKNWATANEENAADFRLLEKLWNKAGEPEEHVFDTNQAWQTVHATLQATQHKPKTVSMFSRRAMVAAAAIVLLLGAWWIFSPARNMHTITADAGVKDVTLDDGTRIWLRGGATLEYSNDYNNKNRQVSLTGEAFFDVAHDTSLPFTIAAANTVVQVVGTSFSVNTGNNQVALTVKTGRVSFSAANNPSDKILVIAGEKALYADNKLAKEINSNENFNAWQSKQLIFTNTPLKQVTEDLNNCYGVLVSIKPADAAAIAETRLTARFNNRPLQEVLDEMSMLLNYRIRKLSDTHYEISLK